MEEEVVAMTVGVAERAIVLPATPTVMHDSGSGRQVCTIKSVSCRRRHCELDSGSGREVNSGSGSGRGSSLFCVFCACIRERGKGRSRFMYIHCSLV